MAIIKQNGDIIPFIKQKDYIMVNNNLGEGSFGKTVLLQDPFIDELFVAKKYEPEYEEIKEQFYKNFLDEIKILYKLNHRNIVRIYNYYAYENIFSGYILMEYIDGEDIGSFIHEFFEPFEDISLEDIFVQLIDAFCYMETKNIVHRDIREGNILIDKQGVVKIIDFGIGKLFSKPEETGDSLVGEINRENSDTLPQEYYEGVYTNLTDMFYLAELFHRLIEQSKYCEMSDFSYEDILRKMMEKRPENRYESFSAVREAIGKHDFINMPITSEDKEIYQEFTNTVKSSLVSYMSEPSFNTDITSFESKLKSALSMNTFETVIQDNSDVISSIVTCGYHYNNRICIETETVKKFLNWFQRSTHQSQTLILNNFISKLSSVKVEPPEPELPF